MVFADLLQRQHFSNEFQGCVAVFMKRFGLRYANDATCRQDLAKNIANPLRDMGRGFIGTLRILHPTTRSTQQHVGTSRRKGTNH